MTTPLASNRAPQSPAEFKAWATSMLAPTGDLPAIISIIAVCRQAGGQCVQVAEEQGKVARAAKDQRKATLAMIDAVTAVW